MSRKNILKTAHYYIWWWNGKIGCASQDDSTSSTRRDSLYCVSRLNSTLFGNVDTIKELTNILVSHTGSTTNFGASSGDLDNVICFKFNLVLDVSGTGVLNFSRELNTTNAFFTKEITDLNSVALVVVVDVDGKVRVHETHLVTESLGDTSDHVLDVRAHGADACQLFTGSPPQVDTNRVCFTFTTLDQHHVWVERSTNGYRVSPNRKRGWNDNGTQRFQKYRR